MSLHPVRPKILGFISEDVSAWLVAILVLLAGGFSRGCSPGPPSISFTINCANAFQLLANERYSRIEERFQDQEQRLDGLRRFSPIPIRFPAANSTAMPNRFCYAPRPIPIAAGQPCRASGDRTAVRSEGFSTFTFRELNADGQLQTAGDRPEYVPVIYTQSQSRLSPLGYDLLAQPLRRATLERADRSGHMAVSQPLHLVGIDPAYARGVLLVAPVTEEGAAKGSAQGYVMAVISMRSCWPTDCRRPGFPHGAYSRPVHRRSA
jgi:hypothetical protein